MNNLISHLNDNQQAAVAHIHGPMMVLAGPGSGKTAVITARTANLVKQGIPPYNILVITYSKAAALEMEQRFKSLYPDGPAPAVTFGTFHSVFYRILRRVKHYSLDQIFAEGERRNLIKSFLAELEYSMDDEFLSAVMNEISLVRNELHDINHYHSTTIGAQHFKDILQMYTSYKVEHNKIDFDDMLCQAYDLLESSPTELESIRRMYTHIMIDEFQDINSVQYEIIKLLAAPRNNLFIVGDDDQSIYRFRGARPEFLLNFPQDYHDTKEVVLEVNYRSTNLIIKAANNLIVQNNLRYNKKIRGTNRKGPSPQVIVAPDQNREAMHIAEKIRTLWKNGENLDEIAVAYRLNIQARAFMDAFLNMNIPFKTRDEIPTIYDHWVAEDIYAYLRVARRLHLRQRVGYDPDAERIINKPFRYISKAFLLGLKKDDQDLFKVYSYSPSLHTMTKANIEEIHHSLIKIGKLPTAEAISKIRETLGYNNHLISISEYRKLRPAGLFEIANELQEAAKEFDDPFAFITYGTDATQRAKAQDENAPCVTLTTLHSAKGLEFERVFIAGTIEDLIPSARSKTPAEIEEERRLLYVGLTRAKKDLYISTIKARYDKPSKPSRFLDEIFERSSTK